MDSIGFCPCCSGKEYEGCCRPFHKGEKPKSALELMRSRYAAYALNLPDYIIDTTHPASPEYSDNKVSWKKGLSQFSNSAIFQELKILDCKEKESLATVVFTAYLSQEGQDATFTEKSYFEKRGGRWLYRGGKLVSGHAPNLVTAGQLRLLPLAYYGEPVLRKKAEEILSITDDIKNLVEDMIETMEATGGMGLAAPQVHHSIRLFVMRTPIEKEEGLELGEIKIFINPKLSAPSKRTWKTIEGCLSIPTLRKEVERPEEITVEYTDIKGERISRVFKGWEARVIMHENDHLNGVLFIDRLSAKEKLEIENILYNLEKRMQDHLAL